MVVVEGIHRSTQTGTDGAEPRGAEGSPLHPVTLVGLAESGEAGAELDPKIDIYIRNGYIHNRLRCYGCRCC